MRRFYFWAVSLVCFSVIISNYFYEQSKIYHIWNIRVKEIYMDDYNKEKMKCVTSRKDIAELVRFANSLQLKSIDEDIMDTLDNKDNSNKINYSISYMDITNSTSKLIVLNFRNNMIYFKGNWYRVDFDAEESISRMYNKFKYMEYGDKV